MHVDLVRNDWDAAEQLLVAQAYLQEDETRCKAVGQFHRDYAALLEHAIQESGLEGMAALQYVAKHFSNDYLFVTEPHEDDGCLFLHGEILAMKKVSGDDLTIR